MVFTVLVILAIRLIVLLVIGDEVVEGESVVCGDEVDTGIRPSPVVFIEVARAGQTVPELG